jgi:hypothetical protein
MNNAAELIQAGGENCTLRPINSLILFGIRKNCLLSGRSPLIAPVHKKGDKTGCSNYRGISLFSTSYKHFPISFSQS